MEQRSIAGGVGVTATAGTELGASKKGKKPDTHHRIFLYSFITYSTHKSEFFFIITHFKFCFCQAICVTMDTVRHIHGNTWKFTVKQ